MKKDIYDLYIPATLLYVLIILWHSGYLAPYIYSDIVAIWNRPEIHGSGLPFVSYNYEYQAIVGWITYLATRWDYNFYILVISFAMMASLYVLLSVSKRLSISNSDLLIYVISCPTMLIYGFTNWDLILVAFALLSVLLYKHKRFQLAGFSLGLSIASKLYSLVFLPIFLKELKTWKERINLMIFALIGWLIPNLPFLLLNFQGWFNTWIYHENWGFEDTWLLYLSPNDHTNLPVKIFGFAMMLVVLLHVTFARKDVLFEEKLLLAGLSWCIFSYVCTPQMVLFLLPLFALNKVNKSLFYSSEIANALIILTWFTVSDPITITATPQMASLIRQLIWVVIFIGVFFKGNRLKGIVREMLKPLPSF